ncbi:MAG: EamA family transporter [Halobacteriales archaeon]|nr:EamA family transporter [Halobacteriales archaeon]
MSGRYRNAGLFLTLAVLFGLSFIGIKTGLDALPPLFFAGLRFDIAAPLLLVFAVLRYDSWFPTTRRDFLAIAVGGVALIAANNGLLFLGQQSITPATASVMYALNPILAPVFAIGVLGERLDVRDAAGVLIGLAGVVVIVQPTPETLTAGSTVAKLYVLGAAAGIAVGSVLLRRIEPPLPSLPMAAWSMVLGAVILHASSLAAGEAVVTSGSRRVVFAVLLVAIPSTAFAYPVYYHLLGAIGPVRTNLVGYVVPIVAALLGLVVLQQPINLATVVGFFVVLAGVSLLERQILAEELTRLR